LKTLLHKQDIPIPLEKARNFYSSPANLKLITPKYIGFDFISGHGEKKIYPGMIISYGVKTLLNIGFTNTFQKQMVWERK
jgi:ligand-binding SRPBCC domain-containing protein